MESKLQIKGVTARARILDRAGRYMIAIGGGGIIAAVMGIFVFILGEAYPLFTDPELKQAGSLQQAGKGRGLAIGVDPYREVAFIVGEDGLGFLQTQSGERIHSEQLEGLVEKNWFSAYSWRNGRRLLLGLDDGRVLVSRVGYDLEYSDEERRVLPNFAVKEEVVLDAGKERIVELAYGDDEESRSAIAGITASGKLLVVLRERQQALFGPGRMEQETFNLEGGLKGNPTTVLVDNLVRQVLVGTDQGEMGEWRLEGMDEEPSFRGSFQVAEEGIPVTALAFILGDVSVIVGDGKGNVSTWFQVMEEKTRRFRRIHSFDPHAHPVMRIAPSQRGKQFLTGDAQGMVGLHHMTSEQTLFQMTSGTKGIADLIFAPKADGFLILGTEGKLEHYQLDNAHPDVTSDVLFKKVWYEGYPQPEFVWQSTGGTDEFESKISMIPLAFGTVKGTFYAMLFALPLAILAAIYTAEFASPKVRNLVKPTVEVMAYLPSVILGFLAGLWLAPILESRMVGTLLLFPLVPVIILAAAWAWHQLPETFVRRVAYKGEIYLLTVVALGAVWLSYAVGPWFERMAFGSDFLSWLTREGDVHYDQRNCLVVGFAMGFAVIPLVFTICEDALSSVPRHLRAGSLALGATPWQTAIKVVLPMAIPGIFSASMIGFGRAIGETMIVLMATGNTPIMDWDIFNGMRTIAANIAVELPEAPHHGSLYRVLFLSGLLLFMVTFCINSLAEVVRQRLREKYNRL